MYYITNVIFTINDQKMLSEHVDFQRKLGVEHFILFDGTDRPPFPEDVFRGQNDVEIIHTGPLDKNYNSNMLYNDAARYLENKSYWVLYNDTDEVLVPNKTNDVRVMMQDYEKFSQVGFHWMTFGSNNLQKEPVNTSFESFTKRCKNDHGLNSAVKSIVRPKDVLEFKCTHFAYLKPGCSYVNERKILIKTDLKKIDPGIVNYPVTQDIGYNVHYRFRSKEHFNTIRAENSKGKPRMYDGSETYGEGDFPYWRDDKICNQIEDFRVRDLYLKVSRP